MARGKKPAKASTPNTTGIEASAGERDELPEGWEWHILGEVAPIDTSPILPKNYPDQLFNYIALENIESGTGRLIDHSPTLGAVIGSNKTRFTTAHVLYGKLRPYLNKVLVPEFEGVSATDIVPLCPVPERLTSEYLALWLRSPDFVEYARAKMEGAKMPRLRTPDLEGAMIAVPPLPEQRRIVAQIEEFARRAEEALERLSKLEGEFDLLCRATLYDSSDGEPTPTPMRELVQQRTPDVPVSRDEIYDFAGLRSFGRGVFKSVVKSGAQFAYPNLTRLRAGDFVYLKLMAWEGAFGVVPLEYDGLYVSPEYPVFEVNTERVLPETLDVYFRSPAIWPTISDISTGTNARRKRLHPSAFLSYEMPLPPVRTQQRLREMKHRVDELRKRNAEQRRELEALMPSVLARAMRGEL